jgi:transmembrane sensor
MEDRYYNIEELILKDLKGTLTPVEKKILDEWIAASPDHLALYNRLTSKEELFEELSYNETVVAENVLGAEQKIEQFLAEQQPVQYNLHKHIPRWKYVVIAASVVGLPLMVWLVWAFIINARQHRNTVARRTQQYDTKVTLRGQLKHVFLPDSSEVWLNAESIIEVAESFTHGERKVRLKGEAFFNIKPLLNKGKKAPFIVSIVTGDIIAGEVEVVGTQFNIDAYGDIPYYKVTVVEGTIKVSNKTEIKWVSAKQAARWKTEGAIEIVPEQKPIVDALWRDSVLSFSKTPVPYVFQRLERVYNVLVEYPNSEKPACLFTGELYTPSGVQKVLNIINDQCDCTAIYDTLQKKIIVQ